MPCWNTLNPKHQRTFKSGTTFFLKLQQHRLSGKVLLVVNIRHPKSLISSNAGCLDTSGIKISPWGAENQSYQGLKQGEHRSTKVRWKLKFKKSATKNTHENCDLLLLPLTTRCNYHPLLFSTLKKDSGFRSSPSCSHCPFYIQQDQFCAIYITSTGGRSVEKYWDTIHSA